MTNENKNQIEAIVFLPDLSCNSPSNRRRSRQRLVSYEDMDDLTNKLHDLYCSAPPPHENSDDDKDDSSLSSSRYDEDIENFGGEQTTTTTTGDDETTLDFSKYYDKSPSSGISPIPLPSSTNHSEEEGHTEVKNNF
jgi:hypothetical protein